jgi:3-hydroxyacyl-CoA dehydrogenase
MKVEEIKKILVIGSGTMGQKSGKGFYESPDPEYRKADFTSNKKSS